jgi:hypothetical protein
MNEGKGPSHTEKNLTQRDVIRIRRETKKGEPIHSIIKELDVMRDEQSKL